MAETLTYLILIYNDREFNLGSFETGLSQFGLETKKLWPKRTEKDLFVKFLYFQGPIRKFSGTSLLFQINRGIYMKDDIT